MKEVEIGPENLEIKEEEKGMTAQELLDELKKWKKRGVKKLQLILKSGPSEDPVILESSNIDEINKADGEVLRYKIETENEETGKKTIVEARLYAPIVIDIKKWTRGEYAERELDGKSGQANDVCWNKKMEEVEKNRTIGDEEFLKRDIGVNNVKPKKELWEVDRDNVAS